MNKEKILESSRRENKNRDLAEMEVTAQAGNIAGRVGAAVCVVLTLIFRIFTKTYFLRVGGHKKVISYFLRNGVASVTPFPVSAVLPRG